MILQMKRDQINVNNLLSNNMNEEVNDVIDHNENVNEVEGNIIGQENIYSNYKCKYFFFRL